jgi:hypothetical protein
MVSMLRMRLASCDPFRSRSLWTTLMLCSIVGPGRTCISVADTTEGELRESTGAVVSCATGDAGVWATTVLPWNACAVVGACALVSWTWTINWSVSGFFVSRQLTWCFPFHNHILLLSLGDDLNLRGHRSTVSDSLLHLANCLPESVPTPDSFQLTLTSPTRFSIHPLSRLV